MNRPKLESAFGAMSPFSKQVKTQDDLLEDGQVVDNSNLDDAPIVPRKQAQQLSQQDIVNSTCLSPGTSHVQSHAELHTRNCSHCL